MADVDGFLDRLVQNDVFFFSWFAGWCVLGVIGALVIGGHS